MDLDYYRRNNALCTQVCVSIWNQLKKDSRLATYLIPDTEPDYTSFKIDLPGDAPSRMYEIERISVAVPSDAMGNRIAEDNVSSLNLPKTIEIAMFGTDGHISYDHPLCNDVLRFNSPDELIDMLVKISEYSED